MRCGVLGGTFDPPHLGHLALASGALSACGLDEVLLMVAGEPPHKRRPLTPARLRLEMAELLAAAEPRLRACDLELRRPGRSYTYDTFAELGSAYPDNEYRLIVGADLAAEFDTWHRCEELVELARPLVAVRPGFALPEGFGETAPAGLSPHARRRLRDGVFPFAPVDVSSSEIRRRVAAGEDVSALLTRPVYDYVKAHALYR